MGRLDLNLVRLIVLCPLNEPNVRQRLIPGLAVLIIIVVFPTNFIATLSETETDRCWVHASVRVSALDVIADAEVIDRMSCEDGFLPFDRVVESGFAYVPSRVSQWL